MFHDDIIERFISFYIVLYRSIEHSPNLEMKNISFLLVF